MNDLVRCPAADSPAVILSIEDRLRVLLIFSLPPGAAVLDDPEFHALKPFVAARGVDVGELQGVIDGLVEQARKASAGSGDS
ncbi:MAG: hypothetical protein M3Z21_10690 [Pseudomonadota bacterium]|nr:hypothetical protein [Pseudomonadota bacterium]